MDELLTEFVAETREMLEASEGEIVAWETDPSDRARLDAIFRFVHTVKGNCGFFDFPHLEKLSHAAEDVLAEVRAGRRKPDAALVTAVLAVIDRISEMVDAIEKGEGKLTRHGALLVDTGKFTGRSVKDKFVVRDATTEDTIDWGKINQPMAQEHWDNLKADFMAALQDKDLLKRDAPEE